MRFLIFTVAALMQVTTLNAGIYNYHPSSPMYIGGGFDPFRPTNGFQECLVWDSIEAVDSRDGESAVDTSVLIETVRKKKDFYNKIEFSAQIQGSYGFLSGEGSVDMVDEYAFHSDSMTWVIVFKSDFGKFRLKNESLKGNLSTASPEDVIHRCGREVTVAQRLGVLVYAVITVKNLTESKRKEFEANLNVKSRGAIWSASMDTSYKKILRSALSASDFSVRVRAIGGGGIKDLSDLLGDESSDDPFIVYNQIPSVMNEYINKLGADTAIPIQYTTADIDIYLSDKPTNKHSFDAIQFSKIFTSYERFSSYVNRIEDILYGHSSIYYDLSDQQRDDLFDTMTSHTKLRDQYYEAGLKCFDKTQKCTAPQQVSERPHWPNMSYQIACEANRRSALEQEIVPLAFYEMAKRRELGFIIENGKMVGQQKCEILFKR